MKTFTTFKVSNFKFVLSQYALCVLLMLTMGIGNAWGNTASNSGTGALSNGNIVVGGNHATFTFAPASGSFSDKTIFGTDAGYYYIKVGKNSSKDITLSWACNGGQTIKVTAVSFKVKLANGGKVTFNGSDQSYSLTSATKTCSASNNSGLTSGMVLKLTNTKNGRWDGDIEFQIDDISFTYTITPNAPSVSPTTKTVNVTLNTNDKKTVGYKCFTTSDHFGDYFEYAFDSNPGNAGHMDGDNFYATDSGTYTIKARIEALDNCHTVSAWSSNLTITVNPLAQSFDVVNGSVDISYAGSVITKDLSSLVSNHVGNGTLSFSKESASDGGDLSKATIDGNIFSATQLGTYTLKATYGSTKQYRQVEKTFTITVGKRTPTFSWAKTGADDHIYAGDVLSNVAQAKYGNANVNGLTYTYGSGNTGVVVVDGTTLRVQSTGFTTNQQVTISVSTAENDYYKEGSDSHEYTIEPKQTPEFYMNGNAIPEENAELHLKIGETANFSFDKVDETKFSTPQNPQYVSYVHNSADHTGVLTATTAGDETILFSQTGTSLINAGSRSVHVYVTRHPVSLATTLDGGTWKVDSVYTGAVYSITNGDGVHNLNTVSVISSDETVLKKVEGNWKAVGAGEATLTISHANTNYWAAETVYAHITVEKYTPQFTWNLPETVNYNRSFANPVSSTNTMEGCTFSYQSGDASVINYVNGSLRTFEKATNNVSVQVTQAGNYKWNEHAETFYVKVEKLADHVPFTMNTKAIRDAVYSGKANKGSISCSESGTITLDQNGGIIIATANALYYDIHFSGIPNSVTFKYQQSMASSTALGSTGKSFVVYQKGETGDWSELWNSGGATGDKSEHAVTIHSDKLSPDTRYLRFYFDGTYTGYYKNITVTERTEVTGAKTVDFGAADASSDPTEKSTNINWYNVNPLTLTIEDDNASQFTVSPESIEAKKDSFSQSIPLTLTYKHDRAAVKDTATLVITDGTTTKRIGLKGVTNKITPAITWKENLTPMQRGVGVKNPATSPVSLTYTSTDATIVNVIGDSIVPLKKGGAKIIASFDGTSDPVYNSIIDTIDVEVTDVKVQHINWTQNFKRLKWTDDEVLSAKNTPDFALVATVSYYDVDKAEEITINRPITFTSNNTSVVQVLNDTTLHVVGTGTTTLTAHVDGITDSLYEANAVRDVIVREPSLDCEAWVLEDEGGSINTISSKEFTLSGEADTLYFDAWREPIKVVIEYTKGDLYLEEEYANGTTKQLWNAKTEKNTHTSYKAALSRDAKKVRFYTQFGAEGYHNFDGVYARRARYVEFEDGKATKNIAFTTEDAKPGVAKTKTFKVNYSNITDQLEFEFKGGVNSKFSVVSPSAIGTECGDYGQATVTVQFLSNDVDTYKDTLLIHNLNQSIAVYLEAEVDKHHQQITWNPATTNLKTTDNVTFDATTTGSAAGLSVTYHVTAGSDVATVNATTGALTIIKDGEVTIEARAAGNSSYYDATEVSNTFTISKVKATIETAPTAETMTLPNTNLGECALTGGTASVAGDFAWDDESIHATYNNSGYKVVFTPKNTNWYDTASCVVVVPVEKQANTITWNFDVTEMFCNAKYAFTGENAATASSELAIYYTTSDASIAYVDDAKNLKIIKGGVVTITAKQDGNEIYAAADSVTRTITILRFAPTIVVKPTAASMKIGRLLSDASLTGGRAELNDSIVEGAFAWEDGNTIVEDVAGTFTRTIIFTPSNSNYYEPVSTTQTVKVEKYAPVVTADLVGSQIVYGQALSNSNISGSIIAMDEVKIPHEEVSGTYAWKDGSAIVNAGNPAQGRVVFTPSNTEWYNVVEFDVPLTVTPAPLATATATASLYYGQILSEAQFTNTTAAIAGGIVNGVASWDESLDLSHYYTVGTHELPIRFMPNDPNYEAVEVSGTAVLTVTAGYVFNGANGPSWDEDGNWMNNTKPGVDDPVMIMEDVVITTPITAGGITISNGVNVTVKDGGKLTLGDEDSFVRSGYGNLTIEAGGEVDLGEGKLKVNDFAIETTMASGKSGQLNGATASNFAAAGEAYIDITLGAAGKRAEQWHAFTVPFPVDALNGIFDAETGDKLVNEVNYAIMDYHGDIRSTGKYGWKKYRKTLVPGTFYIMTVDGERTTYRFKKKAGAALIAENSKETFEYAKSGDGQDIDAGWNGIGNPTLQYGKVNVPVQVLDPEAYEYVTKTAGSTNFVVGTPFFYKAGADGSIMMQTADAGAYYAPARRTVREIKDVDITFGNEAYKDHLYISASEEALDSYEQDKDLVKMRMSKTPKVAQIMAEAYGCELSIVNAPMVNDEARYALSLYAPAAGEYTISCDVMALDEDGSQLYLTYNGYPIWNLSSSPMTVTLPKGNSTQFGLKIVRSNAMPTGIEEVTGYGLRVTGAEKMIMDGKLFILRDGVLYDGTGRRVR